MLNLILNTLSKGKVKPMKIKMTEYITEIEADARELRESNTLGANFAMMLSRAFQSRERFDDDEEEDEAEGEG